MAVSPLAHAVLLEPAARLDSGHTERHSAQPSVMTSSGFTLASVLVATSGLFCLATLFFGTRGGYYDSDDYDGNGTAH